MSIFQSTLPVWGATGCACHASHGCFISIHAPRVGSDSYEGLIEQLEYISIHAPRVGSDRHWRRLLLFVEISIHAPRVGSDHRAAFQLTATIFQSTLPVWGATMINDVIDIVSAISILAPRVGSDIVLIMVIVSKF